MGGGDLNSKKAWHPNTMKNQERVWKAEQAAAEEKKRCLELQKERAMERDREELNKLARDTLSSTSASDNKLHWMYDKPDKKVQQEDYLLGKAIDKKYDQAGKSEQNEIPAVSRRVVGSSLQTGGNMQVDLVRKLREDPLLLVKERERAARAAVLNNPVQRSRLTELLRKEQEQRNLKATKKSKKKDKDLDNVLVAKLQALTNNKNVDIAKLLETDESSSDESSKKEKKKKKKKKSKKYKKKHKKDKFNSDDEVYKKKKSDKRKDSDDEVVNKRKKSNKQLDKDTEDEVGHKKKKADKHPRKDSDDEVVHKRKKSNKHLNKDTDDEGQTKHSSKYNSTSKSSNKRKSNSEYDNDEPLQKKTRKASPDRRPEKREESSRNTVKNYKDNKYDDRSRREYFENRNKSYDHHRVENNRSKSHKPGLSDKEKAAKLAEMAAAGAEREIQRSQRVAKQLSEIAADEKLHRAPRSSQYNEARALPDSLEDRIHSNRHYIQRDRRHMNEHFARR